MWVDGICKCGHIVVEESGLPAGDYQNRCTNSKCKENKWHYVSTFEFLDYYTHFNSKLLGNHIAKLLKEFYE